MSVVRGARFAEGFAVFTAQFGFVQEPFDLPESRGTAPRAGYFPLRAATRGALVSRHFRGSRRCARALLPALEEAPSVCRQGRGPNPRAHPCRPGYPAARVGGAGFSRVRVELGADRTAAAHSRPIAAVDAGALFLVRSAL